MNLTVKSNVLSKSRLSDYVGMYTEDQGYNGKKSFKRTYKSLTTTQKKTMEIDENLYLYWTPLTKWAV